MALIVIMNTTGKQRRIRAWLQGDWVSSLPSSEAHCLCRGPTVFSSIRVYPNRFVKFGSLSQTKFCSKGSPGARSNIAMRILEFLQQSALLWTQSKHEQNMMLPYLKSIVTTKVPLLFSGVKLFLATELPFYCKILQIRYHIIRGIFANGTWNLV